MHNMNRISVEVGLLHGILLKEEFMLTKFAIGFGIIFIVVGLLGFVPAAAPQGHLLGYST
jgi:hypothetical protein